MEVHVHNYTKQNLPLTKKAISTIIQAILSYEKQKGYKEVSVVVVGEQRMKSLNAKYRKKDTVTDILSFESDVDGELGDLIIQPQYIQKQAKKFNQSKKEAYTVLFIHGAFHLLGYDHENTKDFKNMLTKELDVYKKISKKLNLPQKRSDI